MCVVFYFYLATSGSKAHGSSGSCYFCKYHHPVRPTQSGINPTPPLPHAILNQLKIHHCQMPQHTDLHHLRTLRFPPGILVAERTREVVLSCVLARHRSLGVNPLLTTGTLYESKQLSCCLYHHLPVFFCVQNDPSFSWPRPPPPHLAEAISIACPGQGLLSPRGFQLLALLYFLFVCVNR